MPLEQARTAAVIRELKSLRERLFILERSLTEEGYSEPIAGSLLSEKTQVERIRECLMAAPRALSVSDISLATGIALSAVRMALYSNKHMFSTHRFGPRRIKWSVSGQDPHRLERDPSAVR